MKRCGLLGEKLGHSYSPAIHAELADYDYRLYENLNQLKEMYGYTGYEYLGTYGMDNTYFLHR